MTTNDIAARYRIPAAILRDHGHWLHAGGSLTDGDLALLDLIVTLYNIGFDRAEIECYLDHSKAPECATTRLTMLEEKRARILADIHAQEKQLMTLDVLRHQLRVDLALTNDTPHANNLSSGGNDHEDPRQSNL